MPESLRKHFCVHYVRGHWYWLHSGLLRDGMAPICGTCKSSLLASNVAQRTRPKHSIAAGKNFGNRADLPALSDLERSLIAPVRTMVNTIKLVPSRMSPISGSGPGHQWALRRHTISIAHEGPGRAASRLPDFGVIADTKVLFLGPRKLFETMTADADVKAKIERIFTVRWNVIGQWLQVVKQLNPMVMTGFSGKNLLQCISFWVQKQTAA